MRPLLRRLSLTSLLIVLGLSLRGYHYGRNPSVWCDENAVMMNSLEKGYGELCGRLSGFMAAPPLFMWLEKATSQLLGDSPYSFRLAPFLASLLSVLVLAEVARGCLTPAAVPWAVFFFAVSDKLLWHACEAKPYSVDVLCASLVLLLYLRCRQRPVYQQCLIFLPAAPALIFLSFPGCFLLGGVLSVMLVQAWPRRRPRDWLALGVLGVTVGVCFLGLVLGPVRHQKGEVLADTWLSCFPDYDHPWTVPCWLVRKLFDVPRYCIFPSGGFLLSLIIPGGVWFWRRDRNLLILLTVPIGLALAASLVGCYPFGYSRVEAYTAPALVLLLSAGLHPAWNWLRARAAELAVSRPAGYAAFGQRCGVLAWSVAVATLVALPGVATARRLVVFWERNDSDKASAYVLAHCRSGDAVQFGMWEYEYYFRKHRELLLDAGAASVARVWLISASLDGENLEAALKDWPADRWSVEQDVRRFHNIRIFLLSRRGP